MKKYFIHLFVVLLLPLLFLTACIKGDRLSLEERIGDAGQSYSTSYEGVIERLANLDVYQQGTHQLITEDQETIILQSSTIDLNRYLGDKVLVKGSLEKGVGELKDVFTVTKVSYLDESKNTELKDYENKTFGFKFSYPATWSLSEQSDALALSLEAKELVTITVFSEESDLAAFVGSREQDESTEVTIGAQKALRFMTDSSMKFYVPNPPKKKIYLIQYTPSMNAADDKEGADTEKTLFYKFLDSLELIFMAQAKGEKCGGTQELKCPDEQVCQLDSNEEYAEGICVPVGGEANQANCPYIAPPADCSQYRISEYSAKGCPARYECVEEGASDALYNENFDETENSALEENANSVTIDTGAEESTKEDAIPADEKQYTVPNLSSVTAVYANARRGFSLLYPKNWYYSSYGPVSGTLWKVGFSATSYEDATNESENDIITLSILDDPKGSIYKKIGSVYYVIEGPSDLAEVMEKMADSVEASL